MRKEKGQSLIEVIIAATVGVLVLTALTFATIFSLRNADFSKNSAQATKLAQEGIERVRASRDRDGLIGSFVVDGVTVSSWDGSSSSDFCSTSDARADSIWCAHISGDSGDCDMPTLTPNAGYCYFKVEPDDPNFNYKLTNIGSQLTSFPSSQAEPIPSVDPKFRRVVIMSDDLNHNGIFSDDDYTHQKEVTVIVQWIDFSGPHESRLTTVLRRL